VLRVVVGPCWVGNFWRIDLLVEELSDAHSVPMCDHSDLEFVCAQQAWCQS
jgi:hypothetical protein